MGCIAVLRLTASRLVGAIGTAHLTYSLVFPTGPGTSRPEFELDDLDRLEHYGTKAFCLYGMDDVSVMAVLPSMMCSYNHGHDSHRSMCDRLS